jgi:ATP-dependent Clp protease adaptor protein ClpS
MLFVGNLIPQTFQNGIDSDGMVIWKLFLHACWGRPHPHPRLSIVAFDQSPVFAPETTLLSIPGFTPSGFKYGVEILNDRTTPMDFVISVLKIHLSFTKEEAYSTTIAIHNNGGVILPLLSEKSSERIALAISKEAKDNGHSLVCRAVVAKQIDGEGGPPNSMNE